LPVNSMNWLRRQARGSLNKLINYVAIIYFDENLKRIANPKPDKPKKADEQ